MQLSLFMHIQNFAIILFYNCYWVMRKFRAKIDQGLLRYENQLPQKYRLQYPVKNNRYLLRIVALRHLHVYVVNTIVMQVDAWTTCISMVLDWIQLGTHVYTIICMTLYNVMYLQFQIIKVYIHNHAVTVIEALQEGHVDPKWQKAVRLPELAL